VHAYVEPTHARPLYRRGSKGISLIIVEEML
jgi:hypothetical protein